MVPFWRNAFGQPFQLGRIAALADLLFDAALIPRAFVDVDRVADLTQVVAQFLLAVAFDGELDNGRGDRRQHAEYRQRDDQFNECESAAAVLGRHVR